MRKKHAGYLLKTAGSIQSLQINQLVKRPYAIPIDENGKCIPTVPYAMRVKVEQELDCLVSEGILEPVQFPDWAELIVPVLKSDGQSVSICGDFRLTINQASRLDRYPIPRTCGSDEGTTLRTSCHMPIGEPVIAMMGIYHHILELVWHRAFSPLSVALVGCWYACLKSHFDWQANRSSILLG